MMQINLQRINDHTYIFKNKKSEIISLQLSRLHNGEFNYNLALKAAKIILESNEASNQIRFCAANRKWQVGNIGKISRFLNFLSKIFDFVHRPGKDGIIRYKIRRVNRFRCLFLRSKKRVKKPLNEKDLKIKKFLKKEFKNSETRFCFKSYLRASGRKLTKHAISDYKHRVRGSIPIPKSVLNFEQPFFKDPFTILSKQAFQKLEKDFTSKDFFVPDHCHYRIIKKDNILQLVHHSAPIDIAHSKAAITVYKEFLFKQFGKEKIAYIEHLYRFKLDDITSLTPEHVYRINIGLTNLEYQDFDNFLAKLPNLEAHLKANRTTVPLEEYLHDNPCLTGREAKGIFQYFKKLTKDPTTTNLHDWLKALKPYPTNCNELQLDLFNELLQIIHFTNEEKENALTGRKIFGFIKSGYTNASLGEYKPWVDQHQFTQFYSELIENSSLASYYEKLAHVIAKVHLAKEHPKEGFRVGSLLPAPPKKKGGPLRWYKVTSCISNSYGIFSFTLESACNDPTLPGVKLFRSTASSSYALHSQATVVNDLNNFNSPGYQGIGRTDCYEEKFFKDRTIPLWVGYNLLAKKHLSAGHLKLAAFNLKKAEEALLEEFNNKYRKRSLKEIIKTHDFLLNDLERQLHPINGFIALSGCARISKKCAYARLFQELVKSYILKIKIKKGIQVDEKKDAKKMVAALKELYKLENSKITKLKIKTLIYDLQRNILTDQAIKAKQAARMDFNNKIYNAVRAKRIEINVQLRSDKVAAKKELQSLIENLDEYADECGESIDDKIPSGIVMCGHSLGGACAQSHTVRWFTEKNRMPLPGTACSLFEFDAPAINKKSNHAFMNWGQKNQRLFRNSKVQFEITRRQEAGDFVVTAGEEHLGAVHSEADERKATWLHFDAAVLKRHPDSRHFPICLPLTAHETRFLEGKPVSTFYNRDQLLRLRKRWQARKNNPNRKIALRQINAHLRRPNDYICTYYTPFIQGIFNREGHFKNRSKAENIEFEKKFYILKIRMWNLQRFMNPGTAEQARKSVSLFWTIIRKLLLRRADTYKLDPIYVDKMGNFAVGENGVLSKA